ncbi:MAG: hypothetical protein D6705_13555 [Deltaproteobacteria bacterium]|nr:MAG: hypothetical protein D6705_13555 [Deltaproteobacteria bacterium]
MVVAGRPVSSTRRPIANDPRAHRDVGNLPWSSAPPGSAVEAFVVLARPDENTCLHGSSLPRKCPAGGARPRVATMHPDGRRLPARLRTVALLLGATTYGAACLLGMLAQSGRVRVRALHHVAYAAVVVSTAWAIVDHGSPWLWLSAAALALLPWIRAGGAGHRHLALLGAVGYAVACVLPWS